MFIGTEEALDLATVQAIHTGNVEAVTLLLHDNPDLATSRLGTEGPEGMSRTLLHIVTDWPGHFITETMNRERDGTSK